MILPVNVVGRGNCLPREDKLGSFCSIFEDSIDIIPRGEWRQIIEDYAPSCRWCVQKIHDQKQEGSCTANAGVAGWENIAVSQFGKEIYFQLSPISLYKRTGRSPSSGSTVSDNVRELATRGALPEHSTRSKLSQIGLNPDHTMPATGFYTRFPSGWEETAKHFRVAADEIYDIRNYEGFMTALLRGYVVHYGRAGHSILGVAPGFRSGQFGCVYQNSWGSHWGDNGFGWDSESFVSRAINQYGAFAYRTVVVSEALQKLTR